MGGRLWAGTDGRLKLDLKTGLFEIDERKQNSECLSFSIEVRGNDRLKL